VTGVSYSNFVVAASLCNCSYFGTVVVASIQLSESFQSIALVLLQDLNATNSSFFISCSFGSFFNSQTRTKGNIVTLSTFTSSNQPLDIVSGIPFSDMFQGQLTNISVSLSSAAVLDKVVLSISFSPSSLEYAIKSVSVIGAEFSQFLAESAVCFQYPNKLNASATYASVSQSLLISFPQVIQIGAYGSLQCQIASFLNPTRAFNVRDVVIATYDSESFPVDVGSSKMPAIFISQALSPEVSLTTYAESTVSATIVKFTLSQASASSAFSSINLTSGLYAGVSSGVTVCSNLNRTGTSMYSSINRITILFNGSVAVVNASAPVECQIAGVITAAYSGSNRVSITLEIFDSNLTPISYLSTTTFGVTCKPGFFAVNGACQYCVAGTYCTANCSNASPCAVCPMGSYSITGSSSCLYCPAGSFASSSGKSVCEVCPSGSTSATGSFTCIFADAFYTASSFSSSNPTRLLDLSPSRNDVVNISGNNITVMAPIDELPYLSVSSNTKIRFPSTMISGNFTLIYVARFEGSTQRSILQACSSSSWVSAFYQGNSGVSVRPICGLITESVNLHGSDWVVVTEQVTSLRTNGVQRTKANTSNCLQLQDSLCINFDETQSSDFAMQTLLWFNSTLSVDQIVVLEASLLTQQRAWNPNRMQVATVNHHGLLYFLAHNRH